MIRYKIMIIIILILIGINIMIIKRHQKWLKIKYEKPITTYEKISKKLKTGDAVLCSNLFRHLFVALFTKSPFSHMGMILKINNEIYVTEMRYDKKQPNRVINFKKFLSEYNGRVWICPLNKKLKPEEEKKIIDMALNELYEFDGSLISYFKRIFYINNNDDYHCAEYFTYLWKQTGLSNMSLRSGFFTGIRFFHSEKFLLKNGYKYLPEYIMEVSRVNCNNKL